MCKDIADNLVQEDIGVTMYFSFIINLLYNTTKPVCYFYLYYLPYKIHESFELKGNFFYQICYFLLKPDMHFTHRLQKDRILFQWVKPTKKY